MTRKQKILTTEKKVLEQFIEENLSSTEIIRKILNTNKVNDKEYAYLKIMLKKYNLEIPEFNKKRSPIFKLKKSLFHKIIENSHTVEEALNFFGLKNRSANAETLKARLEEEGYNYLNFLEKKKHIYQPPKNKYLEKDLFQKDSKISRSTIRKRILQEKLIEYKCAICGIDKWQGKEITLTLDHIDGVNNNHSLENLRFLCPNCDSQQPTYCGKNIHKKNSKLPTEEEINKMIEENNSKKLVKDYYQDLYPHLKVKEGYTCECGNYKKITLAQCEECFSKKETSMDYKEHKAIAERLNKGETLESLGKELGITGNALKRRLINLGINYNKKQRTTEEKILIIRDYVKAYSKLPSKKEKETYKYLSSLRELNIKGRLSQEEIDRLNKISIYILNPKQKEIDEWNEKYDRKIKTTIRKRISGKLK